MKWRQWWAKTLLWMGPRLRESWKSVTKCCKINSWSNGILCPQKTYREMKQSLQDFESLTRDMWRLRPAESFYLMNSQNMLKIIWRRGLCLSGLLPFSTYFQLKVLMSTEPKGKKKKNYMPCGNGRWLHYFWGNLYISLMSAKLLGSQNLLRVMAKEVWCTAGTALFYIYGF